MKKIILSFVTLFTPIFILATDDTKTMLDLGKVFQGSPIIYSALLLMSICSFVLWLYTLLTLRLSDKDTLYIFSCIMLFSSNQPLII